MLTPQEDPDGRRRTRAGIAAGACLVAIAAWLHWRWGGPHAVTVLDDAGETVAAALAAASSVVAAVRARRRTRAAWTCVAVATGAWAGGQAVWTWFEVVLQRATPFPSAADLGFLLFPVAGAVGLLLYPGAEGGSGRHRRLLDGLILASALTLVSWETTLGAVVHAGGDSLFAFVVSLAYPVGDIVLLTMALALVGRQAWDRASMLTLALGFAAMTVADSAFAYLNAVGRYQTGSITDLGWFAAFLLIAVAGTGASRAPRQETEHRAPAVSLLPYLTLTVGLGTAVVRHLATNRFDGTAVGITVTMVVCVLVRQYLALRDNRSLTESLTSRERELRHQAFHDGLTGLANRALFTDRVEHALELQRRDMRPVTVLFCDLDDFKVVNDSLGHAAGDQLLVGVAGRLRGCLRTGDTLARLGGDEFAVLVEGHVDQADALARRMNSALAVPFTVGGRDVAVRASIGLATASPDAVSNGLAGLLAAADVAMYAAKREGRGGIQVFEHGMTLPELEDARLEQALTAAVRSGLLGVVFQPIVELRGGRVVGFEALARWRHDGTDVPPDRFVAIAERSGLIDELTEVVLETSCAQLALWNAEAGAASLRVSVNISAEQITDPRFPARVAAVVDRHGLNRSQLVLELTERGLLADVAAAHGVAAALRALGVRMSLDDFGTGYSSLLHLQHVPLDSIKIDRGFTSVLGAAPDSVRFMRAVIRLAADLGLLLVAEGVENAEQLALLRELECPLAQGYFIARPMPAAPLAQMLAAAAGIARDCAARTSDGVRT